MDVNTLYNQIEVFFNNEYLFALFIFVMFVILSKIAIFIISRVLMNLAKKTKTEVDDLILETLKKPVSTILILIGVLIAVNIITLPAIVNKALPGIIDTIIIIIVTIAIIRIFKIILHSWGESLAKKTKSKIDDQLVKLADNFITAIIWILAFVFALNTWGVAIGPLLAGIGIGGVAIAFALQNTLGNIFGGISLIVDKSIRVDDVVELEDGTSGTVLDVGIRSTKIRTWDNELMIIPNGKLADAKIINYVQPNQKVRVVVPFGVAYGTDPEKVKKIVLKEVAKIENYIEEPAPFVFFSEMADSSLNFKAYFYVNSYSNRFSAKGKANELIYNALNKNKIEIPYPQMDMHMKK